ncbi:FAD-dependent oxidoreductase [Streptomyces alkaliphilus]|uniref:FAD-dependent oxidoreductase n=1 Tax=Streptomyces alkaliphilus TaxID=1472722 RepID=A0A7W3TA03_9ACTN|nr:FAD-dependent oxidoreductase [Streptomyces alkaliphilus]MBB0242882.1 FAD-dependent oxidoreductase [Streptomyces alkaliphilus]
MREVGGGTGTPRRAVVIGSGVAGLTAARAIADRGARVTLVERDRLPKAPVHRAGVPQGRHTHVLLEGGQRALERLLPGAVGELLDRGAPRVGMPEDVLQWQSDGWYRRTAATAHLLTPSRPLLESVVRRRVLAGGRVETVEGTEAVGLTGDAERVTGVVVRERGSEGGGGRREVPADLVVDASGRGSRAPHWLTELGADPAPEERLDTGLAYTSRLYRAGPDPEEGAGAARYAGQYVVPDPGQVYGAVVLPVESGLHLVTLSGLRGCEPPTDDEGFTAFAARLPHPLVREWLSRAEPVSEAHGFRDTANIRRRYDRPGRRPAGFVATGDSLCAFNPVYGQGMTVAVLNALALREELGRRDGAEASRRVHRALLRSSRQAWAISAGADKNMPGATGNAAGTRAVERPLTLYMARVQRRAGGDPLVGAAFRAVLGLVAPPRALFAPRVLRAVLLGPDPAVPDRPPLRREGEETPEPTPERG